MSGGGEWPSGVKISNPQPPSVSGVLADQGGWLMAMARRYSRVTHQTAALILFQTGQPQLLVFGNKLGVFAGLYLSAVLPEDALNWDKSLTIPGILPEVDQD